MKLSVKWLAGLAILALAVIAVVGATSARADEGPLVADQPALVQDAQIVTPPVAPDTDVGVVMSSSEAVGVDSALSETDVGSFATAIQYDSASTGILQTNAPRTDPGFSIGTLTFDPVASGIGIATIFAATIGLFLVTSTRLRRLVGIDKAKHATYDGSTFDGNQEESADAHSIVPSLRSFSSKKVRTIGSPAPA